MKVDCHPGRNDVGWKQEELVFREDDVFLVELPVGEEANLDLETGGKRIDALFQGDRDGVTVVDAEGFAEGVEGDLQTTIQITFQRCFKIEDHVAGKRHLGQAIHEFLDGGIRAKLPAEHVGSTATELLRLRAETASPVDRHILVVDTGWQRHGQS